MGGCCCCRCSWSGAGAVLRVRHCSISRAVVGGVALSRRQLAGAFSLGLLVEPGSPAWPVGVLVDRGQARAVMTAGSALAALGLALHWRGCRRGGW
jgi:hypothetical protein